MKQVRKTLRMWKKDLAGYWGRLNTFHRIVLGITVAMIIVYMSRLWILGPLNSQVAKLDKQMKNGGVPSVIPTFEQDEEIPGLLTRLDLMKSSLDKAKLREEQALKFRPQIYLENRADVLAEAERMILKAELSLLARALLSDEAPVVASNSKKKNKAAKNQKDELTVTPQEKWPLEGWGHNYTLSGNFVSIYNCLSMFDKFPNPARISNIEILIPEDDMDSFLQQPGYSALILKFSLELYYHGK